jgi:hypothetical protein
VSSEYEQLLGRMLEERKVKLSALSSQKGKEKKADELRAEIRYIELELEHYGNALKLFRSRSTVKVGRWGKPEPEEGHPQQR